MMQEPDLLRLQKAYGLLKKQPKEALSELNALAAEGSALAHVYLGLMFSSRNGVEADDTEAEAHFLKAYASGLNEGCYQLGLFYYRKNEYRKAESAFYKGAAQGYLPAIYWLGRVIEKIPEYPDREQVANALFDQAATLGHIDAIVTMGRLYGREGKRNTWKRIKLILKFLRHGLAVVFRGPFDPRAR
jgi:TPR repeat protein